MILAQESDNTVLPLGDKAGSTGFHCPTTEKKTRSDVREHQTGNLNTVLTQGFSIFHVCNTIENYGKQTFQTESLSLWRL